MYHISRLPFTLPTSMIEEEKFAQKYLMRFGDINNDGYTDIILDG